MKNFDNLCLSKWAQDELIDLSETYPNLFEESLDELNKLAEALEWDAQGYIDKANWLENAASVLRKYIRAKKDIVNEV